MNRTQYNSLVKHIADSIVSGLQRNGERVFDLTQQRVPVDVGKLKMSGTKKDTNSGYTITYTAKSKDGYSYASIIEDGIPQDIPIKGDQIIHRKGFTDKKGNYHPPKDIILKNKRLVFIKERKMTTAGIGSGYQSSLTPVGFRVISKISKRKGYHFIANSFAEGIKNLKDDIVFFLSKKKGIKVS